MSRALRTSCKLWERPDHYAGKSWPNWYVGYGRYRDSGCLTNVNFDVFYKEVCKASDKLSIPEGDMGTEYISGQGWVDRQMEIDSVYIVRESHWMVGWVEWIAIHKDDAGALTKANELMLALDGYPCLDDDLWTERETEEIDKFWCESSLRERVEWCREQEESIFAARHNYPPEKVFDWLRSDWE